MIKYRHFTKRDKERYRREDKTMVIIIGATGFIGMYTVDRFLEEGYEVLATGRNAIMKQELEAKGVTCVSLDISKKKILINYQRKA